MTVMLLLCRIKVRRDISIIPAEHGQNLLTIYNQTMHVVRKGDMAKKVTLWCPKQRQVVGNQAGFGLGDDASKWRGFQNFGNCISIRFLEMRRNIHGTTRYLGVWLSRILR